MKVYVISGLGADFKVLEKIKFEPHLEVQFLEWLIPEKNETLGKYVERMADPIKEEEFYLLGYSFGGILVQEIHKMKKAKKVVILGSIKSHKEKSKVIKMGAAAKIPHLIPTPFFSERSSKLYTYLRRFVYPMNTSIMDYFRMRDPYYLKWSMERFAEWKSEENEEVIQIMSDRDLVFPIKYSQPDYVIQNASHLFPLTKHQEVSRILRDVLK